MDISDAVTFGQLAVKCGLITDRQMREVMEEVAEETGKSPPEMMAFIRTLEGKKFLTNFQTSKILKGDTEGFTLGGYRVLYKISSGPFGRVFRAEDPHEQEPRRGIALKVLRRRWSEDRNKIDLFIREGKVGLTLKHPNIVEVLAINQDQVTGQYYIAMEFVEGGNLREILQGRKILTVPEALRIMEDSAAGLTYAFSQGITHRDIKLTNLLISSIGGAKLVDFGLAQMFATMGREDEQVDRTVDYAGLERATGVKSGDVRSDIFFWGCVFYEMLTGKPPLEMSRDRHQRMRAGRFQEVKSLRPGDVAASPSVYAICDTMLAFDPTRRYQTPAQLLSAVKAARREIEGGGAKGGKPAARSLYIAESNERMQEGLRDKFKQLGYRVMLASNPTLALDSFRKQPYDALIVDAGSVGEEGLHVFERILHEAEEKQLLCAGILLLSQEQADWAGRVSERFNSCVMFLPTGIKPLRNKIDEILGSQGG